MYCCMLITEEGDTQWEIVKTYQKLEAILVNQFCKQDLSDISGTRVTKTPKTGRVQFLAIECESKRKQDVLKEIDSRVWKKLNGICKEKVVVDGGKSKQLSQFISDHDNDDGHVLYLPDIANDCVVVHGERERDVTTAAQELKVRFCLYMRACKVLCR